jgi:hypothetical protein
MDKCPTGNEKQIKRNLLTQLSTSVTGTLKLTLLISHSSNYVGIKENLFLTILGTTITPSPHEVQVTMCHSFLKSFEVQKKKNVGYMIIRKR